MFGWATGLPLAQRSVGHEHSLRLRQQSGGRRL